WLGGYAGLALMHALLAATIFTLAFVIASRQCDLGSAALLAAVAFLGASDRLGVRPSSFAALFVLLAVAILGSRLSLARMTMAYALLTIVWVNVHPSSLLAPIIAAAAILISPRRIVVAIAGAVALLVNPYGYHAVIAPLAVVFIRTDHHLGINEQRFPVRAVERLKATALEGHIYNADQFGGYLIWTFDGERRALTDGRNELYHAFIPEDAAAHRDS